MKQLPFTPYGLLALAPQAFGSMCDYAAPCAIEPAPAPAVAIITIRGPLFHHRTITRDESTGFLLEAQSYEAIEARFIDAVESAAIAVVLDIDSPGGLVAGCFELAAKMRDVAAAKGKGLHAYIRGTCASAAYALACACTSISAPATAVVGSIGVLDCVLDATAADAKNGLKFAFIVSGDRKTDGNQHTALNEATLAAKQQQVDDLAGVFFSFVAEARGMSVDAVANLNAGTLTGERASASNLVDSVETFDSLVARVAADPQVRTPMAAYKSSKEALLAEADSDDKKVASSARKALRAMFAEDGDGEDDKDKKDKGDDAPAAESEEKGEGDDDEDPKKKEADPKAALAAAPPPAAPAATAAPDADVTARVAALEADRKKQANAARATERKALLASRPDLAPELLAVLSDPKQTPLETLRAMLPTIKEPEGAKVPQAGGASASAGQRPALGSAHRTAPAVGTEADAETEARRQRMGLVSVSTKPIIRREGHKMIFQVVNETTLTPPEGAV